MVDLHQKFEFLSSLSMIHARDVINFQIIEGVQKNFAGDHFELDKNKIILIIFLASLDQNTDVQCVDFQRTLSEGQEIDIRSFFFASPDLRSYDWNSLLLLSYHSA